MVHQVRLQWGADSAQAVKEAGVEHVDFRVYQGMGHDATEGEIDDVCKWLSLVLPEDTEE